MTTETVKSDTVFLFATRIVRLFAYGFLSVVLVLYLTQAGLREKEIGFLLTLSLAGDVIISLWITTSADRAGRRRMLLLGAGLMMFAGAVFVLTKNPFLIFMAAIVGVFSPSGKEIGPFLSIEQASLSQLVSDERRTKIFAWYNLAGSFATALGALCGGGLAQALQNSGWAPFHSYRAVLAGYTFMGFLIFILFTRLSPRVEARAQVKRSKGFLGLHQSRGVVMKLSALFALDAFGGGFVIQSILAYWFHVKFGVKPAMLGSIFFGANFLAGISALSAARLAAKIGLVNTMVFTHIPSNILLILVPLMPNLPLAVLLLLLRFSISQMDVPTRQSYTMAVVSPDERSAASGVTSIARSVGTMFAPVFTGYFLANPSLLSAPFFLAGGFKIVYDLLLYFNFRAVKPSEEKTRLY